MARQFFQLSEAAFKVATEQSRMKGKALDAAYQVLVHEKDMVSEADARGISRQSVAACIRRIKVNAFDKLGACPMCGSVHTQEDQGKAA